MTPLVLHLSEASKTRCAGQSLARTLYRFPVDILLTGDLGAGKTTFMQGFAEELGIEDAITSPTYSLEQRYTTKTGIPLLHLDLYRLKEQDAVQIIDTTEEHDGIRCIEWADRLGEGWMRNGQSIHVHFSEAQKGRELKITFDDCAIPTQKQIDEWRAEVMLPAHIVAHCNTVADISSAIADALIKRGEIVRKDAVIAAAKLHDLLRFIDFKAAAPQGMTSTEDERETWDAMKKKYPDMRHEDAVAAFLREQKFPELAEIIKMHGVRNPMPVIEKTEQKILFYADKRAVNDRIVSVKERFDDFAIRYGNGTQTNEQKIWLSSTLQIEQELFPDGVPEF